jgi:hypothetical protein
MRLSRIFAAVFAVLAICIPAASPAEAQAASPAVRQKTSEVRAGRPVAARPREVRRNTAETSKSVTQRLFDARWVIFPARLTLVIVFLTVALLLLSCGTWGALRIAHSLWHTKWRQPPRQLKRGELGAAGTSLSLEFEERMHENLEHDAARDRQLATLHAIVARLSREHDEVAATVADLLQRNPESKADGSDIKG